MVDDKLVPFRMTRAELDLVQIRGLAKSLLVRLNAASENDRSALSDDLIAAGIDDAIEALCAVRLALDPAGYAAFVERLYPWTDVLKAPTYGEVVCTVRDMMSEPHSGTVTAEGRTSTVIDE